VSVELITLPSRSAHVQLKQVAKECFTTDDIWIAGYLATRANTPPTDGARREVRRVIVPERMEPWAPSWKANEPGQWRLSTFNSKNLQDIHCIRAVERRFGPWPFAQNY
jgi:hypothetical protein